MFHSLAIKIIFHFNFSHKLQPNFQHVIGSTSLVEYLKETYRAQCNIRAVELLDMIDHMVVVLRQSHEFAGGRHLAVQDALGEAGLI